MEPREVPWPQSLSLRENDGQRVPQGQGGGRGCRGGQAERASLPVHAHVQNHVGVVGERRFHLSDQADNGDAEPLERGKQAHQLMGLAAVGDGNGQVPLGQHAQVAMDGVGGMDEQGGRPGAGESRGDLPGDDARFPHAGEDHAPGAGDQQFDGLVETMVETGNERRDRLGLRLQDFPGRLPGPAGPGISNRYGLSLHYRPPQVARARSWLPWSVRRAGEGASTYPSADRSATRWRHRSGPASGRDGPP